MVNNHDDMPKSTRAKERSRTTDSERFKAGGWLADSAKWLLRPMLILPAQHTFEKNAQERIPRSRLNWQILMLEADRKSCSTPVPDDAMHPTRLPSPATRSARAVFAKASLGQPDAGIQYFS